MRTFDTLPCLSNVDAAAFVNELSQPGPLTVFVKTNQTTAQALTRHIHLPAKFQHIKSNKSL